ncbi:MAG: hypothetical protein HYV45_03570 [Candidatus Moranbacteria bacterium]|nr:hypothetical protein [Candidatus Moranbacteria bacterium]
MLSPTPTISHRDKRALLLGGMLLFSVIGYFVFTGLFKDDANVSFVERSSTISLENEKESPFVEIDEALKKIHGNDKAVFLDIRGEQAFALRHIPQSLPISLSALAQFVPVNKDETVIIVFSKNNSDVFQSAKNILKEKTFPYFFLRGGFEEWEAAHAPTISFGDPLSFVDQSKVVYISLVETKKILNENKDSGLFVLLDVQTEENYKKKHLQGAIHIPLENLEKRVSEIPAGRQIIVYGGNDVESFRGGVRLFDLGIFSAKTLSEKGVLSDDSGLPLEP